MVMEGLRRLEYRGYDSAGIACSFDDSFEVIKTVGRVNDLAKLIPVADESYACIGHTRWATHGGVTKENAHPHTSDKVVVVHNGIIDNADELRVQLYSMGYEFVSETDSEVIAHLIDSHLEDDVMEAVERTVAELHGTYGMAVLFRDFPGTIVAARNGSPLVIGVGENEHFVASEPTALTPYTNRFIYMEDGDIAILTELGMYMNKDRSSKACYQQVETIDFEDGFAAKGDFEHFMLKEIYEQPDSIKRCFGGRIREDTCVLGGINLNPAALADIESVTIIACGTSYHAGLVARDIIEEFSGVPCSVELASEFANKNLWPKKNGIYLAISQSGETYDTLESIKELQQKGIPVYGVVNVVGSSIARNCGHGVYIHTGPEIAVASTKAFTGQLAALMMFACMLGRTKYMSKIEGAQFTNALKVVPDVLEDFIDKLNGTHSVIQHLAKEIAGAKYVLFLGRGPSYPVALEGALKLKEIAYVPCEAYAGGEMKHGPIAMIEEGTPVICINPLDSHNKRMLTNIQEVKARGAKIISLCSEMDRETQKLSDFTIFLPTTGSQHLSPFFSIVPLQLLAYDAAIANGNDVDKPRNLAKSVTVS